MKDLLPLFAVTLLVAFGLVPTGSDTSTIWNMVLGYAFVALVFLWVIPGIGMELSMRLDRFGTNILAAAGSLYTIPVAALTFMISYNLCQFNQSSDNASLAFACLSTALAIFSASNNFYSAVCDKLAHAKHRAAR